MNNININDKIDIDNIDTITTIPYYIINPLKKYFIKYNNIIDLIIIKRKENEEISCELMYQQLIRQHIKLIRMSRLIIHPGLLEYLITFPKINNIFQNIEKFYFNLTSIKCMGNSLNSMINLKYLNLRGNYIEDINGSFKNLVNLEELILDNNKIVKLDNNFDNLNKLKKLSINTNNIKKIGRAFDKLDKLEYLDISNNSIKYLGRSIIKLRKIKEVNLDSNPLYKRYCIKLF